MLVLLYYCIPIQYLINLEIVVRIGTIIIISGQYDWKK